MPPAAKSKLVTAVVVFVGIVALTIAKHFKADPDWLVVGGSGLAVAAGLLRSMVLEEKKDGQP